MLHRHGRLQISNQGVFVNLVGGVKVLESKANLVLLMSLVSSLCSWTLPMDRVVFGEVGLAKENFSAPSSQEGISEAAKYGFKRAIVLHANAPKKPLINMQACRYPA